MLKVQEVTLVRTGRAWDGQGLGRMKMALLGPISPSPLPKGPLGLHLPLAAQDPLPTLLPSSFPTEVLGH
jgi:hypothetical protein